MLAFGSQIMSCVADIANTALRLIKSSSLASHDSEELLPSSDII